ncbi:class I SAM-dependent methyltransferase [Desulfitobacterium sp. AusDCA]|uniref:class I SAM-dependent methyltransferase n=1 Tax=Desulfitobacterium sp. AusDCA TaxID=3240383 RepID=UPI003DA784CF
MIDKKTMNEDSVEEYDGIAEDIFGPIYPIIVGQITDKCNITTGICLDIGCCGGHLGVAMAQATNLQVILMDRLENALKIADARIIQKGLQKRMCTLLGDVHQIPLPGNSIRLVISRGSVPFWQDRPRAFQEIYRVLAPGGAAYIGGGFGSMEQKERIAQLMKEKDPSWGKDKKYPPENRNKRLAEEMREAGIGIYEAINNESGNWMCFRKPIIN